MAEPLACAQCTLRAAAERRLAGLADSLRRCAIAPRRSGAGPGWLWLALNAVALRSSAPGLGWLALAPVWAARRRRAMAEPPACSQCGARGGRTVPGWQADTCAGTRLRYGRAGGGPGWHALALRAVALDWAGWHLLRYELRGGGGLRPSPCLRPVRCARRPNGAWLGWPTPAPVRDCATAGQAGGPASWRWRSVRSPYGSALDWAGWHLLGYGLRGCGGYGRRPRSRAVQSAWRPNGARREAAGPGWGLQNGPR